MPAKRSFDYVRRSREDIIERANQRGGDFDDFIKSNFKKYKVRQDKNVVRILPPTWEGANHYGLDIFVNYGIGSDNQNYLSLERMGKGKDPLTEAMREAEREGNEKVAKALRAKKRILVWVIDRQAENEGPQLWAAPFTLDKDIALLSSDEDTTEVLYIDDPAEGYDVRFYAIGQGRNREYPAAKIKLLGPGPLHEDSELSQDWLDYIKTNPLPTVLNFYSYEHISQVFNGQVRMDDDERKAAPKPVLPSRAEDTSKFPRQHVAHRASDEVNRLSKAAALVDDDEVDEPAPLASPKREADTGDLGASIRDRLRRTADAGRRRPVADED